jgi:hypothetical protein
MTNDIEHACVSASARSAILPASVARRRNVRSRRAAADHDGGRVTEADRVARTPRERPLFARSRSRDDLAPRGELASW